MVSLCISLVMCCRTGSESEGYTRRLRQLPGPDVTCLSVPMQRTHNNHRPQTARVQCHHPRQPSFCAPSLATISPPQTSIIITADHSLQSASPFRRSAPSPAHWSSTPQSAATPINRRPRLAAPPPSPARYGPHPPSRNRAPPTASASSDPFLVRRWYGPACLMRLDCIHVAVCCWRGGRG